MSLIHYGHLRRLMHLTLPTNGDHDHRWEYVWDVEVSNCTGLTIGAHPENHLFLRNSTEMRCASDWLRTLWDNPLTLLLKGISPQYADESITDVYDATDLVLDCYKTRSKKPRLYIGTTNRHRAATVLHSREATIALSAAIAELAELFDDPESDLFRDTTFADTQD